MRKTYFLLLLGSLATAACSEDKYVLDVYSTMRYDALPLPTATDTSSLRAVDFVSAREGFVGGDGGALFATTDGGQTWTRRSQPTLGDVHKLLFTSPTAGWLGSSTGLYRTTNGGQTWQRVQATTMYGNWFPVYDLQFVTPQLGYAVGDDGGVVKTTDGGSSWRTLNYRPDYRDLLRTVSFCSPDSGMALGDDLVRWTTTNGGRTWDVTTDRNNVVDGTTYDLLYQGPGSYQQAKTTGFWAFDQAVGFDLTDDEAYGFPMYGLATTGPQGETVAVGYHTIIRRHAEYSQNPERTPWAYVHAPDGTSFQGVYYAADFADASTFYAVGAHGTIHRFHCQ